MTTVCDGCQAELSIEFDPPDRPGVRALIERLDEVQDDIPEMHARTAQLRRKH